MAYAHSPSRVLMNRSALPLVLGVSGMVRMGLRSKALQAFRHPPVRLGEPLSQRTRRQVIPCSLNQPTARIRRPTVVALGL